MQLEGVVTNVTAFGAFVDVGVHQDGLVHISQLADRYVEDPREVVKAGQVVAVKVLEVDVARKRIALTMKLHERPTGGGSSGGGERGTIPRGEPRGNDQRGGGGYRGPAPAPRKPEPEVVNPLAAALSKLNLRRN
jgi:uncharacterized protein